MKLYDVDEDEDEAPSANGHEERTTYSELFGAPDFAAFIKTPESQKARAYERKMQGLMKAGVVGAINSKNYPDAAAFLKYGPGFARASGQLANADKRAAEILDMLTSPSNPYAMFVVAALPMIGQLFRNHQQDVEQVKTSMRHRRMQRRAQKRSGVKAPRPEVRPIAHIKFGKRSIPIKVGVQIPKFLRRIRWSNFMMGQTTDPEALVNEVFSDPKVVDAVRKLGARPDAERNQRYFDRDGNEYDDDDEERNEADRM